MDARSPIRCTSALIIALAALALSATMAWAAARDLATARRVPEGVTMLGHDLSGMSEVELRDTLARIVRAPLFRPVTVQAAGEAWQFDPRGAVQVDLDAMCEQAFAPGKDRPLLARLRGSVLGSDERVELTPVCSIDESRVAAWLADVASHIDREAVDASLTVDGNRIKVTRSRPGVRLDRAAALHAVLRSLSIEDAARPRIVEAPIRRLEPKVDERDLGPAIVVDISERRVRLFVGDRLVRSYPCAVGSPSFPTPRGRFEIVAKRYLPTWVNPAPNGWGANLPRMIPPGPANPLGTRALNLSAPGIRLHGTNNIASIGTAASHGCMRMLRADIEDLYERVGVGTPVFIVD